MSQLRFIEKDIRQRTLLKTEDKNNQPSLVKASEIRVQIDNNTHQPILPCVAILLSTYQGQSFLADQLESFAKQTHSNWQVHASDDGSEDKTLEILNLFKSKWPSGKLCINSGPATGFASNFLSLTCKNSISAHFYAYSDQDDIWENDKLERAVHWLNTIPPDIPALYCSRTRLVDVNNNHIGFSPLFTKPPSFANALMQNIGGGNTMVFNNAARELLGQAGNALPIITHDWWAYIVVSGCGGQVHYDPFPSLRYRQHGNNLVGMNSTWPARILRIKMLWQGRFRHWNNSNIDALEILKDRLTPENQEILNQFSLARKKSLLPRLTGFLKSGIYRQTPLGNLGLIVAAIFNKI